MRLQKYNKYLWSFCTILSFTFTLVLFQNCGTKKFNQAVTAEKQASTDVEEIPAPVCDDSEKPNVSRVVHCSDINDDLTGAFTSKRTVQCDEGQWIAGTWSANDLLKCSCSDSKASLNVNGQCVCPAGYNMENGACKAITCNADEKPSATQTLACPGGDKNAYQTRSVTCDSLTGKWKTGSFGPTNYSQCTCNIAGASINPSTGECACPAGRINVNNVCIVPECTPGSKKEVPNTYKCPSNGNYTITETFYCGTNGKYTKTGETSNYTQCSCANVGEVMNQTGVCSCPAGQTVVGGKCMVPSCTKTKPSTTVTKACPTGSTGTVKGTRAVSCRTSDYEWVTGEPAWDYDDCACADKRYVFDKKTLKCIKTVVACDDTAFIKKFTATHTFPGNKQCEFGKNGNRNKAGGVTTARVEELYTANLPAQATLCSMKVDFPEQNFYFDDHIFFDYSGMIIGASYKSLLSKLPKVTGSTDVYQYDWTKIVGLPTATTLSLYCYGSKCVMPSSEKKGKLIIEVPDTTIRKLSTLKNLNTQHTFRMTTTGDDDSSKDCMHVPAKMNVTIEYVVPN